MSSAPFPVLPAFVYDGSFPPRSDPDAERRRAAKVAGLRDAIDKVFPGALSRLHSMPPVDAATLNEVAPIPNKRRATTEAAEDHESSTGFQPVVAVRRDMNGISSSNNPGEGTTARKESESQSLNAAPATSADVRESAAASAAAQANRSAAPSETPPESPRISRAEQSRLNGAKSRGPATDAGKAASSRNALTHGLTASHAVLVPGEDPAEFDAFAGDIIRELHPDGRLQLVQARRAAEISWRLQRLPKLESTILQGCAVPLDDAEAVALNVGSSLDGLISQILGVDNDGVLLRLQRYEVRLEKSLSTALRELRMLQGGSASKGAPAPVSAAAPSRDTPASEVRRRPGSPERDDQNPGLRGYAQTPASATSASIVAEGSRKAAFSGSFCTDAASGVASRVTGFQTMISPDAESSLSDSVSGSFCTEPDQKVDLPRTVLSPMVELMLERLKST